MNEMLILHFLDIDAILWAVICAWMFALGLTLRLQALGNPMEPAPIRNKALFYGLIALSFGLLAVGIILMSVKAS